LIGWLWTGTSTGLGFATREAGSVLDIVHPGEARDWCKVQESHGVLIESE